MAIAGRHQRVWVPTSRRPHPHLLESGLARSPSLAHQPLYQRQCPSLRWIRAKLSRAAAKRTTGAVDAQAGHVAHFMAVVYTDNKREKPTTNVDCHYRHQ